MRERFARHGLAVVAYAVLAVLAMWPVLPHFGSALPGGAVAAIDGWQNVWNLWWAHRALGSGTNPFFTTLLYYPTGVGLYLQTLNISNGVLFYPITALWGQIAAYNTAVIVSLLLAGLGGYALALHVSGNRLAAFCGGLAFAFSPFHMTKIWDGQLELASLQWIAWYALLLLRTVEARSSWNIAGAAIFLALVGYTSWYYFFFTAVYSVLFVALWCGTTPGWRQRGWLLGRAALVAAGGIALLAPVLGPALGELARGAGPNDIRANLDQIVLRSANGYDFWLPSAIHPLWGERATALGTQWHPDTAGWNVSLGYVALVLAVVGGVAAWRAAWRWWLLLVCVLVLALGPLLHIGTAPATIPLPYQVLLRLPGGSIAWRPSYFVVIATLLLAPLVALGVRSLLERFAARRWIVAAVVLLPLALEYAPPRWPLHAPQVDPYYATLPHAGGALLELPPPFESATRLQEQMVHGRPIGAGYVSRQPFYPFADAVPGVRQLWTQSAEHEPITGETTADDLAALNYYGIDQVIVHWDELTNRERRRITAALEAVLPGVAPAYADERLRAYQVPRVAPQPFSYFADQDWYDVEAHETARWRWLRTGASLVLVNPFDQAQHVDLRLRGASFAEPRALSLAFDGQPLPALQFTPDISDHMVALLVPPGAHVLRMAATPAPEPGTPRKLSVSLLRAEVTWR